MDAQHRWTRTPRLHRVESRDRRTEEASVLGLPPCVDDDRGALSDGFKVPSPNGWLDRLPDRRHVLELVVVLLRFVGPGFPEHPDRCRGRVEDVHAEALGDAPHPPRVGVGRHALVHYARGRERERTVHDVGVTGDPADIGHTPVDVGRVNVLVVLRRPRDVREVAAGAVLAALRLSGGPARVHQEQRRFRGHRDRLDPLTPVLLEEVIDHKVPSVDEGRLGGILAGIALPHEDLLDLVAVLLRAS